MSDSVRPQVPPAFPVLHYLREFAQTQVTEFIMLPSHLILCRPLSKMEFSHPSVCHRGILGSAVSYLTHEFEQTLGDSEGREVWHAAVRGVAKRQAQLSD